MMELIEIILKYLYLGISKVFKFVWSKWRLAGILCILLIIEILVLFPVYEETVNYKAEPIYDFEILSVEQTDDPNDREKLFVTIDNKSGAALYRAPSLKLIVDEMSYYLYPFEYYSELVDEGYHLYKGNSVPPGTKVRMAYEFSSFLPDDEMAAGNAKLIVDDYSYNVEHEYSFDLKATKGTPNAS